MANKTHNELMQEHNNLHDDDNVTVWLKITSWRGISFGAKHFYGTLHPGNIADDRIELEHNITAEDAALRNVREFGCYDYKDGDVANGFDTRADVIVAALEVWRTHYPNYKKLVLGNPYDEEPGQVLDKV